MRTVASTRPRRNVAARIMGAILPLTLWVFGSMAVSAASPLASSVKLPVGSSLNVVAARIETMGLQTFPDSYAGVKSTTSNGLTVFLSKNDPRLTSEVRNIANAGGLHVAYVYVKSSFEQLVRLEEQMVTADRALLLRNGISVVDVHPDAATNQLLVTLETPAFPDRSYVQRAQVVLTRLYGSGIVTVNSKTMLPTTEATYRYDDYSPFYGGDQIGASGYSNYCSSGFAEYSSVYKTDGVLTAGHCWPTGASVYVDCVTPPLWACGSHGYGFGNYIGKVLARAYPPNGGTSDFEITGGSSAGYIWGGTYNNQTTLSVKGVFNPPVGDTMSLDGSVTGERDGLSVTEDLGCVSVNYPQGTYTVCNVGSATGSSAPCQGGDSGGPAFVFTNGGVDAAGTIISVSGNTCWFQEASWEQTGGNLTILTS